MRPCSFDGEWPVLPRLGVGLRTPMILASAMASGQMPRGGIRPGSTILGLPASQKRPVYYTKV